jgi:hypothetical protein
MKNQLASIIFPAVGLAALALGWHSLALAQYQPVTVQVSVSEDESYLEIDTPSQCSNANGRGCIEAKPGTQQRIMIVLGGDERCGSGGAWSLSAVILGGENSPTKPARWGGLNLAARDFDVDPGSGLVRPEQGSNARQFNFINRNSAAYDVWYTVQAECNGQTIEADPRIRNGGLN